MKPPVRRTAPLALPAAALLLFFCALGAAPQAATAQASRAQASRAQAAPHVELTSGEELRGRVELKTPFFKGRYLLLEAPPAAGSAPARRIGLDSVRAFRSQEGYFRRVPEKRRPVFARRLERGRLDLYERTSERSFAQPGTAPHGAAPGAPGPGLAFGAGAGALRQRADYFAAGTGALRPVTQSALREAMQGDPESLRHLSTYRTLGRVQIGLVGAGLGTVVAGALQLEEGGGVPPLMIVGAVVAASSWIPHLLRRGKLREALRSYNR